MTLVVDASVVVAALVDSGPDGRWAEQTLGSGGLIAPHILPAEVANVLRRSEIHGDLTSEVAALAHVDLLDLPIHLFPYEPFGPRVRDLRDTVNAYDGWYVAIAEALDAPLATLDLRLSRSPGPTCAFSTPAGRQT